MRVSHAEAVKMGLIEQKDVPADVKAGKPRKGEIEGDEQVVVIDQFRAMFPDVGHLLIHIPNGGSRKNAFEGYRLKRQGVRAGVSDLLLPVARGGYFGLWIEFKAEPPLDAAVTGSQKEWIDYMRGEGYWADVCLGPDAAIRALKDYLKAPPTQRLVASLL